MITQFTTNGLITGLLYALLALSFSLMYSTTRIFHIAYAGVLVVSSYIFYTFLVLLHFPFVISLILALLITGVLNTLIDKFIYQKLEHKKLNHNSILVASIGVFIILINLVAMLYGNENKSFSNSISNSHTIGNLIITQMQLIQCCCGALILIVVLIIVNKTDLGIRIKALSNNSTLYKVLGHSVSSLRAKLFFISGVLAAIVSFLISYDIGFDPYFGMHLLLNAMVAMIIGGFGSFKGSVVGGMLLGIIQSLSIYFFESRWENAISFIILIMMLIFMPQGLFGEKQRMI